MRVLHLSLILSLLLNAPAHAFNCRAIYEKANPILRGTGFIAGGVFYGPVTLPAKMAHDIYKLWRERGARQDYLRAPFTRLSEDRWQAGIFAFLKLLQLTTGLTFNQYQVATSDFEKDDEDKKNLRVIIDAFSDDDPLYSGAGAFVYNLRYSKKKNAFLLRPKSMKELVDGLKEIAQKEGRPITHLDYYGHGLPGTILLDKGTMFAGHSHSILETPDGTLEVKDYYDGMDQLVSTFAIDAKIRFNSCFGINGTNGREIMTKFGSAALGESGGTLYASKVQILPNLVELLSLKFGGSEPPAWLRTYGDQLSAYNGGLTLLSGLQMRWHGLSDEGPFHVNTTDRIRVESSRPEQTEVSKRMKAAFTESLLSNLKSQLEGRRSSVERPWAVMDQVGRGETYYPVSTLKKKFVGDSEKIRKIQEEAQKFSQLRFTHEKEGSEESLTVEYVLHSVDERERLISRGRTLSAEGRAEVDKIIQQSLDSLQKAETEGGITHSVASQQRNYIHDLSEQAKTLIKEKEELHSTVPNEISDVRNRLRRESERVLHERAQEYTGLPAGQIWVLNGRAVTIQSGTKEELDAKKTALLTRFPTFHAHIESGNLWVELYPPKVIAQGIQKELAALERKAKLEEEVLYAKELGQLQELQKRGAISGEVYGSAQENLQLERKRSIEGYFDRFLRGE